MAPEIADIVRLLPSGAATVAVITVVILFLKQQKESNEINKQIAENSNLAMSNQTKSFQDQINSLFALQHNNQKEYQTQIQLLIDSHLKVSRETIIALKGLELTVSKVREKISLPNKTDT
jgi:hypothetical protein